MALITIDTKELRQLAQDMRPSDMLMVARARKALKKVSFATEKRVKQEMPVDTGRARASWGHWSGGTHNPEASEGDSIFREEDGGLSIIQGSNVPYIEALNAGHSQQAPAGFIDKAKQDADEILSQELAFIDILRRVEAGGE